MAQITSVFVDTITAAHRLLCEELGSDLVGLGTWGQDVPLEGVLVLADGTNDGQRWTTTNYGRDEEFDFYIDVQTCLQGRSAVDTLARKAALTDTVERVLGEAMQGNNKPPEVRSLAWWWQPALLEHAFWGTSEGYAAGTRITVHVFARIGGT